MKKLVIVTSLLASGLAFSEVKPAKQILEEKCGVLNKSQEICVARTVDRNSDYIVLTGFMFRDSEKYPLNGYYYPAISLTESRVGASTETLTATVAEKVENRIMEKQLKLVITKLADHDRTTKAQYYVNGKKVGPEMKMKTIYHTESIE